MSDIAKIIEERDRTFALMLARVEKAEAENDRLWAENDRLWAEIEWLREYSEAVIRFRALGEKA